MPVSEGQVLGESSPRPMSIVKSNRRVVTSTYAGWVANYTKYGMLPRCTAPVVNPFPKNHSTRPGSPKVRSTRDPGLVAKPRDRVIDQGPSRLTSLTELDRTAQRNRPVQRGTHRESVSR